MNRSVGDVQGGLLIVSQFTLAADVSGGQPAELHRRGGARAGAAPLRAGACHGACAACAVAAGEFGADMQVHLINDGPVTIPIALQK
jgi:D-tyrosyl-tRNA(Tyr) deacylase